MAEAHKLCDHIALLNEGEIVEYGNPDELCRKYNQQNTVTVLGKDGQYYTLINSPEFADKIAEFYANDNVAAIHSSEPNLEAVFMKLTGKELDV
jgi:ABC-2 type transport system ATP-binding protein